MCVCLADVVEEVDLLGRRLRPHVGQHQVVAHNQVRQVLDTLRIIFVRPEQDKINKAGNHYKVIFERHLVTYVLKSIAKLVSMVTIVVK